MKLGRVAEIDVFLHWTFVFAPLALILQSWYRQQSIAMTGMLLVLLACVFGCVLLHEFGHAFAAKLFGVKTKDIILTPIGGLARLMSMPKRPLEEFVITIAGPLVNLVIAAVAGLGLFALGRSFALDGPVSFADLLLFIFYINLFLFLFNLLPAFPMDGGRILRATLASFLKFQTATLIAGAVGQVLAVALIVYGLFEGMYSLPVVGVFVFIAASAEISSNQMPKEPGSSVDEENNNSSTTMGGE